MAWGLLLALFISIIVFHTFFHLTRKIVPLLMHAILGVVVFAAFNYTGVLHVPINWLTILISSLGGLLGVAAVVAIAALGIPL